MRTIARKRGISRSEYRDLVIEFKTAVDLEIDLAPVLAGREQFLSRSLWDYWRRKMIVRSESRGELGHSTPSYQHPLERLEFPGVADSYLRRKMFDRKGRKAVVRHANIVNCLRPYWLEQLGITDPDRVHDFEAALGSMREYIRDVVRFIRPVVCNNLLFPEMGGTGLRRAYYEALRRFREGGMVLGLASDDQEETWFATIVYDLRRPGGTAKSIDVRCRIVGRRLLLLEAPRRAAHATTRQQLARWTHGGMVHWTARRLER